MDSFIAISEPSRRRIMELLARHGEMPASAIYKKFRSSPPAISQHLKVLKDANLVRVEKRAQQRIYFINPEPLKKMEKWLNQFTRDVEDRYQRLDALLEEEKAK